MKLESTVKCPMTTVPVEENADESQPVWVPLLGQNEPKTPVHIVPAKSANGTAGEPMKNFFADHIISPIELQWKNIRYSVSVGRKKEKKVILKDVSGKAFPGELTAVLGPSGSGKSTLLNILSRYIFRRVSGEVLMNGSCKFFQKNICSYIMQNDLVLAHLTVKELVTVASRLKLPETVTKKERETIVEDIIATLGLTDCMNTKSNCLSGGERKRLCIAQELVSNPSVLFLDEPTSGLDSLTCLQCVKLLKNLAEKGHTVICSIHQPSANLLTYFDKLYILSDGECIYKGTVPNLLPFLSTYGLSCPQYHNPADFIIEIASGAYGTSVDDLKIAVKREETPDRPSISCINCITNDLNILDEKKEAEESGINQWYASSPWTQFKVLLWRTYISIYRDPLLTQLRFVMHGVLGLLIGLLYWKVGNDASLILNNSAFLFFTMLFLLFTSIMPTVITLPMEMQVFLRENHNNWHRSWVYYLAKTLVDFPFQIVFTLIFCAITYWMTDQPQEFCRFALFSFNLCLLSAVSQSVGIISGSIAGLEVAVFVAPSVSVPVMLFSNFFLKLSQMPIYLRWLSYLSYFRYNYQISMQAVYGYDRPALECSQIMFCGFTDPKSFMAAMDVQDIDVIGNVFILIAFFVVIRAIGYGFLMWKVRSRQ